MQGPATIFVVIDSTKEQFSLSPENIRFLADRHFGVGADQVLVIGENRNFQTLTSSTEFFNHDGGEVEQCGITAQGVFCTRYVSQQRPLTDKKKIKVETVKEIIEPELLDDGSVRVMMNTPSFRPSDLPFSNPKRSSRERNQRRKAVGSVLSRKTFGGSRSPPSETPRHYSS